MRVFSFSVDIWSFYASLCVLPTPSSYDSQHIVVHSPTSYSSKMYPKPQQIQLWSQFQYSHPPTQILKITLFLCKGCLFLFTCLVPIDVCAADVINASPHCLLWSSWPLAAQRSFSQTGSLLLQSGLPLFCWKTLTSLRNESTD